MTALSSNPSLGSLTNQPYRIDADGICVCDSIVAVHGLASKSQLAWTHRTTGRQWLREFLPAGLRHRARILAFSHDSRWQTHALLKSFESYGADLLLAVERARHPSSHPPNHDPDQPHSHHQSVSTATARRPLIFLCHSFGGLIVKKALVMANVRRGEEARFAAIADATVGVVFLGVPHEGSKLSKLARAQSAVLKAFGSSSHLLELVGEDSETARRLHHDYLSGYAGLRHVCFYESEETYVGSVPIGPVRIYAGGRGRGKEGGAEAMGVEVMGRLLSLRQDRSSPRSRPRSRVVLRLTSPRTIGASINSRPRRMTTTSRSCSS